MKALVKTLGALGLGMTILCMPAKAGPANGAEAFEKLKSLVGHWETERSNMKASLDIELTSGGTAVLEKVHMVDDGKPVEMTTLYYQDGGDVKLTHYCTEENQPTMRGTYSPKTKILKFELVSISNLREPGRRPHASCYVHVPRQRSFQDGVDVPEGPEGRLYRRCGVRPREIDFTKQMATDGRGQAVRLPFVFVTRIESRA